MKLSDLLGNLTITAKVTNVREEAKQVYSATHYEFEAGTLTGDFAVHHTKEEGKLRSKEFYVLRVKSATSDMAVYRSGHIDWDEPVKQGNKQGRGYFLYDGDKMDGGVFIFDNNEIQINFVHNMRIETLDLEKLTNREVIKALKEAEGHIWDSLSLQAPDKMSWTSEGYDMKFFEGLDVPHWIAVYCVTGTSEGIYIHVDFIGEKRHLKLLGKTFIGDMQACYESAGHIAQMLGV